MNEAMYIESVPNRGSPPAILLRESWREDGKVRKRTLANLSCLSREVLEGLKVLLRGGVAVPSAAEVFVVERSLPHGHVAAVLGSARGCGASSWFGSAPKELQPLLLAMLIPTLQKAKAHARLVPGGGEPVMDLAALRASNQRQVDVWPWRRGHEVGPGGYALRLRRDPRALRPGARCEEPRIHRGPLQLQLGPRPRPH